MDNLEALAAREWQPIETAPKDGTRILVFNGPNEGYHTYPGDIGASEWDMCLGRMQWGSVSCCDGVSYFVPTHWMPLPKPPQSNTQRVLSSLEGG